MLDNYGDNDYTIARPSVLFLLASRSCGVEEDGSCVVEVVDRVDVGIVGAGMDLSREYRKRNGEAGVVVVGGNTKNLRMAVEDSPS